MKVISYKFFFQPKSSLNGRLLEHQHQGACFSHCRDQGFRWGWVSGSFVDESEVAGNLTRFQVVEVVEDFPFFLHIQWILFISAREIASALWHIVIEWKAWWDAIAKLSECCNFLLFITGHDFSPVSIWSYLQPSPNISKNYDLTYCDWMESKVGCKTFYLLWLSPQCTTATAAVQPSFSQIAQECTRYHQSTTLKFKLTVFPRPWKIA